MKSKHINLIYPQWQGGGNDLSTYYGAKEFQNLYLDNIPAAEAAVSTDRAAHIVNGIFGYDDIVSQMRRVQDMIKRESPDTIFTVGGGCDTSIPAVSYLNHKLNGDMTVLWFDSHGDLNTPQSSLSKNFHGMPLRVLLGDGDRDIAEMLPSKLAPAQAVLLGVRDLDADEQLYIKKYSINTLSVSDMELRPEIVTEVVCGKGSTNLYIHIDLDVLEPDQFPHVPLPVLDGLNVNTLQRLLQALNAEFNIAGLSLVEYKPTGRKRFKLLENITGIGTNLYFRQQ
jgi:arginase